MIGMKGVEAMTSYIEIGLWRLLKKGRDEKYRSAGPVRLTSGSVRPPQECADMCILEIATWTYLLGVWLAIGDRWTRIGKVLVVMSETTSRTTFSASFHPGHCAGQ